MSTPQKIKGFIRTHRIERGAEGVDSLLWTLYKCGGEGYDVPATLVLNDEAYTATEVKAMLKEVRDLAQQQWIPVETPPDTDRLVDGWGTGWSPGPGIVFYGTAEDYAWSEDRPEEASKVGWRWHSDGELMSPNGFPMTHWTERPQPPTTPP